MKTLVESYPASCRDIDVSEWIDSESEKLIFCALVARCHILANIEKLERSVILFGAHRMAQPSDRVHMYFQAIAIALQILTLSESHAVVHRLALLD